MESLRVGLPTLVLILVYLAGINVLGAWIGRGQKDARDYFLGSHAMPWWAVMGSIVATETSALTFLSIPGDAYRTGFAFLQLVFGYILGRFAVSFLLLPSYFKGELATVYALLETRFGPAARRFTSLLFMVTRVMAAAVRLAVPAIPIALILGIPIWAHYSWLPVFPFYAWAIASGLLPREAPGHSTFEYWTLGRTAAAARQRELQQEFIITPP